MDKIDTSQIVDPSVLQPFTGRSLTFLQDANKAMVRGIVRSLIGDDLYGSSATTGVAISGCTFNGSGNTMFEGYIWFQEELYYFPGVSGLNSFSFTARFDFDFTDDGVADPVQFSDGSFKNVHKKRRLKIIDSAFAAQFDMTSLLYVSPVKLAMTIINSWSNLVAVEITKRVDNFVYLSGQVSATSAVFGVSGIPFVLPTGYRPAVQQIIATSVNVAGTYEPGLLRINTNGNVEVLANSPLSGASIFVYFDGIFFKTDL